MSSDPKIRTLHVLSGLGIGGAQAMLVKLLSRADGQRFQSAVLALVDRGGGLRETVVDLEGERIGAGVAVVRDIDQPVVDPFQVAVGGRRDNGVDEVVVVRVGSGEGDAVRVITDDGQRLRVRDRCRVGGPQGIGVAVCFGWSFGLGMLTFKLMDRFMKIRVSPEDELKGLDISEHGTNAYPGLPYAEG